MLNKPCHPCRSASEPLVNFSPSVVFRVSAAHLSAEILLNCQLKEVKEWVPRDELTWQVNLGEEWVRDTNAHHHSLTYLPSHLTYLGKGIGIYLLKIQEALRFSFAGCKQFEKQTPESSEGFSPTIVFLFPQVKKMLIFKHCFAETLNRYLQVVQSNSSRRVLSRISSCFIMPT